MNKPEFSTYSLEELVDSYKHIDKVKFPDRVEEIKNEIRLRNSGIEPAVSSEIMTYKKSESNVKKRKKSARGLVLAIWPAAVIFAIYYGKFPSRNGLVHFKDEPGSFITYLLIFIGVGFYFYHSRDDT
jgi:hypothetical protein